MRAFRDIAVVVPLLCVACGDVLPLTAAAPDSASALQSDAPRPPGPSCAVTVQVGAQWDAEGLHYGLLSLDVSNLADLTVSVPWTLTLVSSTYVAVDDAWNWTATAMRGGYVEGQATTSQQMLLPRGQNSMPVGAIFTSTLQDLRPTSVLLNGQPCLTDAS